MVSRISLHRGLTPRPFVPTRQPSPMMQKLTMRRLPAMVADSGFVAPRHLRPIDYYIKGTVLIPEAKIHQIARYAKLGRDRYSQLWLREVTKRVNMYRRQGKSLEYAVMAAIVESISHLRFRYTLPQSAAPFTQSLNLFPLLPPAVYIRRRIGSCGDISTLTAATLRHFNIPIVFVLSPSFFHVVSGILRRSTDRLPRDLTTSALYVSKNGRTSRTPIRNAWVIYPLDAKTVNGSISRTLGRGVAWAYRVLQDPSTKIFDGTGRSLLTAPVSTRR